MKMKSIHRITVLALILTVFFTSSCGQNSKPAAKQDSLTNEQPATKYKVTFIELGSVRCIPCQQMQPIMKSIEEKYGSQVQVKFYDVWTPLGKPMADKYNIQLIPTQVFLDENGKEFFRHEGFFAEDELIKVLKTKGVE
jgi:thioredoxin 1